ncbi:MAG: hypothetical protein K2M07_06665 [Muribaculaceae bacterium]|nr:hypothetical protein [Muribaculaceae bacterium]
MRTISEIEEAISVAKRKVDKAHTSSELTTAINELSHLNFELSQAEKFKASGKENAEHLALEEIRKWANGSHAHLSQSSGYARGYKEGIGQAKEIICSILARYVVENEQG